MSIVTRTYRITAEESILNQFEALLEAEIKDEGYEGFEREMPNSSLPEASELIPPLDYWEKPLKDKGEI